MFGPLSKIVETSIMPQEKPDTTKEDEMLTVETKEETEFEDEKLTVKSMHFFFIVF